MCLSMALSLLGVVADGTFWFNYFNRYDSATDCPHERCPSSDGIEHGLPVGRIQVVRLISTYFFHCFCDRQNIWTLYDIPSNNLSVSKHDSDDATFIPRAWAFLVRLWITITSTISKKTTSVVVPCDRHASPWRKKFIVLVDATTTTIVAICTHIATHTIT